MPISHVRCLFTFANNETHGYHESYKENFFIWWDPADFYALRSQETKNIASPILFASNDPKFNDFAVLELFFATTSGSKVHGFTKFFGCLAV